MLRYISHIYQLNFEEVILKTVLQKDGIWLTGIIYLIYSKLKLKCETYEKLIAHMVSDSGEIFLRQTIISGWQTSVIRLQ